MNRKLNSVLLIDDDEATNFLHKLVINKADFANEVIAMQSAKRALDYLSNYEIHHSSPELILLDINMPIMNGWEFLEEYNKLNYKPQKKPVIVMLTTSINPDDREKAMRYNVVNDFKSKPLTIDMVGEMHQRYFA